MNWTLFLGDLRGLLKLLLLILVIVTPIMTLMEGMTRADAFSRGTRLLAPVLKRARMSAEGGFALLVGLFFGIAYGAGPLVQVGREGRIGRPELTRVGVFLAVCHAIVEDTLLWVAVGASWLALVPGRLLFAVLVTEGAMALRNGKGGSAEDGTAGG